MERMNLSEVEKKDENKIEEERQLKDLRKPFHRQLRPPMEFSSYRVEDMGYRDDRYQFYSTPPTVIEWNRLRFLIMDAPTDETLPSYIRTMKENNVVHLVRLCAATYDKSKVEKEGIEFHDWSFRDGASPPPALISEWLLLIEKMFGPPPKVTKSSSKSKSDSAKGKGEKQKKEPQTQKVVEEEINSNEDQTNGNEDHTLPKKTIAVHCAGGFGRAPVLVAIALIEEGVDGLETVSYLREQRHGVINRCQLMFIDMYSRRRKSSKKPRTKCCIM